MNPLFFQYAFLFLFLNPFCLASDSAEEKFNEQESDLVTPFSPVSSASNVSVGSKRDFSNLNESSEAIVLPDEESVSELISSNTLGPLEPFIAHLGKDLSSPFISRVADLAISHENEAAVQLLVDENSIEDFQDFLFAKVCRTDSLFGINYLLKYGFIITTRVIKKAIQRDAISVAAEILSHVDDLAEFEETLSPRSFLFYAVSFNMVDLLIDHGSNLGARDNFNRTPIRYTWDEARFNVIKAYPLGLRTKLLRQILNESNALFEPQVYTMTVDRNNVLAAAYSELSDWSFWYDNMVDLNIKFEGENLIAAPGAAEPQAVTGTGLLAEFISLAIQDIFFTPERTLFVPVDSESFHLAPVQDYDEDLLGKFRFAGTLVALALRYNIPLRCSFIPFIIKTLFDLLLTFDDLKDHDLTLFKGISPVRADPEYDFTRQPIFFFSDSDRQVTPDNVDEFLADVVIEKMIAPYAEQVQAFLAGLKEKSYFFDFSLLFTPSEFASVLTGDLEISAQDFVPHFAPDLPKRLRQFFLKFFDECDAKDRVRIISFITGCIGVPVDGISSFEPRLSIENSVHGAALHDLLPRSSTCSNKLYLPPIQDYETFKTKFRAALDSPFLFGLN